MSTKPVETVEASELGIKPGYYAKVIHIKGDYYVFERADLDDEGQVAGWYYISSAKTKRLLVIND